MNEKEYIQFLENEVSLLTKENKELRERIKRKETEVKTIGRADRYKIERRRTRKKINEYSYNIKEARMLECIINEMNENGFSPSFRYIMKYAGYNSTASVKYAIDRMCEDKILKRNENVRTRNLEIINFEAAKNIISAMVE